MMFNLQLASPSVDLSLHRDSDIVMVDRSIYEEEDIPETYENLIGIPYIYGGNDTLKGIDCSRLVQLIIDCKERHSETIYLKYKDSIPELVFFKGKGLKHIGYMINDTVMIHATPIKGVHYTNISSDEYKYLNQL